MGAWFARGNPTKPKKRGQSTLRYNTWQTEIERERERDSRVPRVSGSQIANSPCWVKWAGVGGKGGGDVLDNPKQKGGNA